jgi:hypothetical protein
VLRDFEWGQGARFNAESQRTQRSAEIDRISLRTSAPLRDGHELTRIFNAKAQRCEGAEETRMKF